MFKKTAHTKTLTTGGQAQRSGLFLPLLLLIMSAYPPLSTDMYLPSFPEIVDTFDTTESTVNLTLVLFFVFFAFATLIWGPISDKFGRKPSLIAGIALYTVASAGCIWSGSVHQMITWRVLQALGAGAPVTISIAIVQDTYAGKIKKKILATLTALMMIAPVIAPTMGSTVLLFAPWRTIFGLLCLLGMVSLVGCLFIRESIQEKKDQTVIRAFGNLFGVLKNAFFRSALVVFSLPGIYALGFVGGSAVIFMSEFGCSRATFSLFFAINAVFAIVGAWLYIPAVKWFRINSITTASFIAMAASGILIVCFGRTSAVVFLLCVLPGTLMSALLRPLSVDLMMDTGGSASGAASSMINFFYTLFGSMGMQLVALDWHSRTMFYGIMAFVVGAACALMWPWVHKTMARTADV